MSKNALWGSSKDEPVKKNTLTERPDIKQANVWYDPLSGNATSAGITTTGTTSPGVYSVPSVSYPTPSPTLPNELVDKLAKRLEVEPTTTWGSLMISGHTGSYDLVALFMAMLDKLEGRIDAIKTCPECGEAGEIEAGDYLCKGCRHNA